MQTPPTAAKPSAADSSTTGRSSPLALVVALFLVSVNLRPTLISLGPVLDSVQASLGLSETAIGFLITLPVLCFGAFAPLTPGLLRYLSAERIILLAMVGLVGGIILRSLFGTTGLVAGTIVAGACIAVIMVLVPAIIKRNFPMQASMMMGLYSTALCLGAAVAAGVTVPIKDLPGSNWRLALAFWLVPVLVAVVTWLPHVPKADGDASRRRPPLPRLRSNLLAWQVTMHMGLQSAVAYCLFGWLPFILIDRGLSQVTAGLVLSACMGIQLITSLSGPWLATRGKDQRLVIAIMLAMTLTGLMGCFYAPLSQIWGWSLLMGLGLGGVFSIALALLVLRAPNAPVAAALSGMAQGVGYTIAATGPFVLGLLHELTGGWDAVAAFFAFLIISGGFFGMGAGRARYIKTDPAS